MFSNETCLAHIFLIVHIDTWINRRYSGSYDFLPWFRSSLNRRKWFFHERNRPKSGQMAMHRQSGEMERKAVNCMEVHSADWISILYERSRVCAYVTGREHARPFDVGWRKRANGYCSRHTQNDTDRKLKKSFPAGNVHRMSQKRFDLKFINEFVNEKAAIPPRSPWKGYSTLYTRVISNLRNFGHRSFALERNFSSNYVHTQEVEKRRFSVELGSCS